MNDELGSKYLSTTRKLCITKNDFTKALYDLRVSHFDVKGYGGHNSGLPGMNIPTSLAKLPQFFNLVWDV